MTKSKIALAFLLIGSSTALAAGTKTFKPMEGADRGCKVAKFSGGKWVQAPERDLDGQLVSSVTPSKANNEFSNFKFQNVWYAARNTCLQDSSANSSLARGVRVSSTARPKYWVEFKLQKTLLLGTTNGAATGTVGSTSVTYTNGSYGSGLGVDGRFGYLIGDNKYLTLDVSTLPASQTTTLNNLAGGTNLPTTISDTITLINVGLQIPLQKPLFGLNPFVGAAIGYARLSGIENQVFSYSGSGFDIGVEGGLVKNFTTHWSALGSLALYYLSITPKVDVTNSTVLYPVGESLPSRPYTHFTLAIGGRYSF